MWSYRCAPIILTCVLCARSACLSDAQTDKSALTQDQTAALQLPCEFSGEILRTKRGAVVRYTSAEMKSRAIHKVDVSRLVQQADIKGTVVIDVLVDASGKVRCTKSLGGHPLLRFDVERALSSWVFRPVEIKGHRVAYLGRMEFTLCNINCGKQGASMTLLR